MSIIKAFVVPHPPLAVHEVGKGEEDKYQARNTHYNNTTHCFIQ